MKITAELIQQSPQFTNPLNERQLDLRGYKITAIENMGATLVPPSPCRTSSSASISATTKSESWATSPIWTASPLSSSPTTASAPSLNSTSHSPTCKTCSS